MLALTNFHLIVCRIGAPLRAMEPMCSYDFHVSACLTFLTCWQHLQSARWGGGANKRRLTSNDTLGMFAALLARTMVALSMRSGWETQARQSQVAEVENTCSSDVSGGRHRKFVRSAAAAVRCRSTPTAKTPRTLTTHKLPAE